MIFYITFFCIPFIYNIYQIGNNHEEETYTINYTIIYFNYFLALICQIVLVFFEYADIQLNGFDQYISDGWNIFDSMQIFMYLIHMLIRFFNSKIVHGMLKLIDNIL